MKQIVRSVSSPVPISTDDKKARRKELRNKFREPAKKILALCMPWPEWTVCGGYLVAKSEKTPVGEAIVANDDVGKEVLSFIPDDLKAEFLSDVGQAAVSLDELSSILMI